MPLPKQLKKDILIILSIGITLTIVSILLNLDMAIAKALYIANAPVSTLADDIAGVLYVAGFIAIIPLIFTRIRKKYPQMTKSIIVIFLALLITVNGVVEAGLKKYTDRPRPKEIKELGGQDDYRNVFAFGMVGDVQSKSFPSSSAAIGFLLTSPFFTFRRKNKAIAYGFLTIGLLAGTLLGLGRMIGGMHFFTDVLWSGVLVFATLSILYSIDTKWKTSG